RPAAVGVLCGDQPFAGVLDSALRRWCIDQAEGEDRVDRVVDFTVAARYEREGPIGELASQQFTHKVDAAVVVWRRAGCVSDQQFAPQRRRADGRLAEFLVQGPSGVGRQVGVGIDAAVSGLILRVYRVGGKREGDPCAEVLAGFSTEAAPEPTVGVLCVL